MQTRDDRRGVARKRVAARSDEHQLAAPAAHAGFGEFGIVIRDDVFDAKFACETLLSILEEFDGLQELFASGEKQRAVGECPAVILDVRKFDAGSGRGFGKSQHFGKLIEIAPVNDEIQRESDAAGFKPAENADFMLVRMRIGDFSSDFRPGTLEAELEMVEAGGEQSIEARLVKGKSGGNEIHIQSGRASRFHKIHKIGAGKRLPASEINLEDAGFGSLEEDAGPLFGREFQVSRDEFLWIRAVDAMERASVGEFGDERERIWE